MVAFHFAKAQSVASEIESYVYENDDAGLPLKKVWKEYYRASSRFDNDHPEFCKTNHYPWFLHTTGNTNYQWVFF
jgi:hypothetical protein